MAKKKAPKQAAPAAAKSEAVSDDQESKAPTQPKRTAVRAKRASARTKRTAVRAKRASARAKRAGTKRPRRTAGPRKARKTVAKNPARRVRGRSSKRIRYTDEQRQRILSTAKREGLSALKVKKRFGVTPVTYYAWLRKSGAMPASRRGRPVNGRRASLGLPVSDGSLARLVRDQVRAQIQQILPEIVKGEVDDVFSGLVAQRRRRRG